MSKIMRNNIEYAGVDSWEGTQAQYDALPVKYPNITYYITDTNGNDDQFQPIIYSTEEREIGVWVDGKPLYQKTYIYTPSAPLSVALLSIDKIIDMRAISYQTSGAAVVAVPYGWDSSDRALFYYHPVNKTLNFSYSSMNSGEWFVTIRYTKTTDTAGSGTWTPQGVPAIHYSTSEHVIGTWIDGKPIYEKTVHISALPSTAYTATNYAHNITNIDTIIDYDGVIRWSSGQVAKPMRIGLFNDQPSSLILSSVEIEVDKTNIMITVGQNRTALSADVTLQYTKSS